MTDLERYQPGAVTQQTAWVGSLDSVIRLAGEIANTEFVPKAIRGSIPKVTACILYGQELGLGPMQSLSKIDVIDGTPAPRAELGRALVLGHGHEIEVVEASATKATVRGRRAGKDRWHSVTWTMDDAKRADLVNKTNWRKYPRRMLVARASAEVIKDEFSDLLGGIAVFAEELDDGPVATEVGEVVQATAAPKGRTRKLTAATGTAAGGVARTEVLVTEYEPPLPDEIIDAEVVDDNAPSEAQTKRMFAMLNEAGIKSKEERLSYCSFTIGRDIESSKDLTKADVSKIIDALSSEPMTVPQDTDERPFE